MSSPFMMPLLDALTLYTLHHHSHWTSQRMSRFWLSQQFKELWLHSEVLKSIKLRESSWLHPVPQFGKLLTQNKLVSLLTTGLIPHQKLVSLMRRVRHWPKEQLGTLSKPFLMMKNLSLSASIQVLLLVQISTKPILPLETWLVKCLWWVEWELLH